MLTPDQKANLQLFIKTLKAGGQPTDEFLRDSVEEINAHRLQGEQLQQRDKAVALYYHRAWMLAIREKVKK